MLGRLARWLRLIGCDTEYEAHLPDPELAARALREARLLLTRDRGLVARFPPPASLLVESEDLPGQIRQVVEALQLDWRAVAFTRCLRCNDELLAARREDALAGGVPARVLEHCERFLRCSGCRRFYWEGSHVPRMRRLLERILGS
jgi:hypothetical protein